MNILQIVGPILLFGLIVFTIYSVIVRNKELSKYKVLISNTNDSTVLAWMVAFKKTRNFNTRSGPIKLNSIDTSQNVDDKLRYIQIYEIVKDSANVSSNVKEQLKVLFLSEGIPIKP